VRYAFNAAAMRIRKILWEDWDPICCGVPEDEYDDYVSPVYDVLRGGGDRAAVRAYLLKVATETIGCPPVTPHTREGLERAVDKLLQVKVERETAE